MAKARRLPSGKWRILQYWYTDADEKRHYKSFTATTKKEAERMAARFLLENNVRINADITLRDAYTGYIGAKEAVLSPVTVREYKRSARMDLQELMGKRVMDITQIQIQQAISHASLTHSPKSVRNMHGLLAAVMKTYRPGFVLATRLPPKEHNIVIIPTNDEIKRIYDVVKGSLIELPFLLASQCGLREGEICGLTRDCVLDDRIVVRKSMALDTQNRWILKAPKTHSGNREIPCSLQLIEMLRSVAPHRTDLCDGAPLVLGLTCHYVNHRWGDLRKQHNIPFTFHALRHYFASQAILQGIPEQYLVEIMGHNSSTMLRRVYAHTFPDVKYKMAQKMITLTDDLVDNATPMQHKKNLHTQKTPT